MDLLVNLIVGEAGAFDFIVLVRLIVFLFVLDFVSSMVAALGGMRK